MTDHPSTPDSYSIVVTIDGTAEDADSIAEALSRMSLLDETNNTESLTIMVGRGNVNDQLQDFDDLARDVLREAGEYHDGYETAAPQPSTPKSGAPDTFHVLNDVAHRILDNWRPGDYSVEGLVSELLTADRQALADAGAVILMPGEISPGLIPLERTGWVPDDCNPEGIAVVSNGSTRTLPAGAHPLYRLSPSTGEQS